MKSILFFDIETTANAEAIALLPSHLLLPTTKIRTRLPNTSLKRKLNKSPGTVRC